MKAVIFDLGNTLVSYYQRRESPGILREAIENCWGLLDSRSIAAPDERVVWARVKEQDHGSPGNRVYPLPERLSAIFEVDDHTLLDMFCAEFMRPIFCTAKLHGDVKPTLKELRRRGIGTAIISNTPWGSPPRLWRAELDRHGLTGLVDAAVFCGDIGWRKPDPRIFHYTLDRLGLEAGDCLFVGDDPRWDVAGPRAVGMDAVLIDRTGVNPEAVKSLSEVLELVTRG